MNYMWEYLLVIIAIIITSLAQLFINISYSKYKKINNKNKISGKDIAHYILEKNGLSNVKVVSTPGNLSDHYDPSKKVVRLSNDIYNGESIASLAVAAHECGHALQDKDGYIFMRLRSSLIPVVNFISHAGYIAIFISLFLGAINLLWVGIFTELAIFAFQLVTLPVEINASSRALKELKNNNLVMKEEVGGSRIMLISAASTYVASVTSSLLQVLRLLLIVNRKKD